MDLATPYLGLELANPLVPSASPLSQSLDTARELEDAGAAGIVMYSLFEETIDAGQEAGKRRDGLDRYLGQLLALKHALDIPVIASLNGVTPGGWIEHGRELEAAGADALELNVYYVAADIEESGADVERRYLELLHALRTNIAIPINMKLSPAFSSVAHMVKQLEAAGADGVCLFNRFYQPDIHVDSLRLMPSLHPSTSAEALLALRWIAILYGRTGLSLGATGGIHTAEDAIKLLLAGADVVHLCSALLVRGPGYLREVLRGIERWMEDKGFQSIQEVRGRLSQISAADPEELERTNYVRIIESYSFGPQG